MRTLSGQHSHTGIPMMQTQIEVLEKDGVTVAVLGTEYDNLDEEQLMVASDTLLSLAKSIDPPLLLLDLSQTRFFGSGMLGVIFRVWNRISTQAGFMAMCGANGVVADVLKVTNVEKLWKVFETQEEAVAHLSNQSPVGKS